MSYQAIARKYRPQRFADIVGQEHITRTLQNAILEGRIHHAYLFTGIRGIGKTTLARILAKALNCSSLKKSPLPEPCNECPSCMEITKGIAIDIQEIDGASNTGVDDVRDIREKVKYMPSSGKYKIYIIDEVHMLSTAAFNALLKTLEEPPAHAIFMMATTETHKIPATILSRCQRYDFRRIPYAKIVETLRSIAAGEGVTAEEDVYEIIANESEGSMRDAESLFDQVIAFAGKKIEYAHLKDLLGFLDRSQLESSVRAVVSKDTGALLDITEQLFNSGEDLDRFLAALLDIFHSILIAKAGSGGSGFVKEIAEKVTIDECQQWLRLLHRGCEDLSRTKYPKIVLDSLAINLAQARPVYEIDELIERLDRIKPQAGQVAAPQQAAQHLAPARPLAQPAQPAIEERHSGDFAGFLEWLKLNRPNIHAFVSLASRGNVSGGDIVIGFKQRSFATERLEDPDSKAFAEKLASDYFKRPLKIRIEVEGGKSEDEAELKRKKLEESAVKNRAVKESALGSEAVRNAASIFGAEIKEIKVK